MRGEQVKNVNFFRYIKMYQNFEEEGEDSVANYTGCTQDCIRYSYSTKQIASQGKEESQLLYFESTPPQ